MKNKSQMLKGTLEGCVLKIISIRGEVYGYDVLKILKENGFEEMSEGTLYPLFTRLLRNKYINSMLRESPLGPARKYYSLTEEGREFLSEFEDEWSNLSKNINKIIEGKFS